MKNTVFDETRQQDTRDFYQVVREDFIPEAAAAFSNAHEDAPYTKYMFRASVMANTGMILAVCGSGVARRRREMENSL